MYTMAQAHAWEYNVLQACPWFEDCPVGYFSSEEEKKLKVIGKLPKV